MREKKAENRLRVFPEHKFFNSSQHDRDEVTLATSLKIRRILYKSEMFEEEIRMCGIQ